MLVSSLLPCKPSQGLSPFALSLSKGSAFLREFSNESRGASTSSARTEASIWTQSEVHRRKSTETSAIDRRQPSAIYLPPL